MKKIIAGIVITAFALMLSLPASAAVIDEIDDSSMASSVGSWLIKIFQRNNNRIDINNSSVTSTSNSGKNTVSSIDDQADTDVATGNSVATTVADNAANSNLVSETYESVDGSDNDITDVNDESNASATTSDVLNNDVINTNNVGVDNKIEADSDSGSNTVASGDGLDDANVASGNSEAGTGVFNFFNTNIKEVFRTIRTRTL